MARLPGDYVTRSSASRQQQQEKEVKFNSKIAAILTLFLIGLLELFTFLYPDNQRYKEFIYPFINTVQFLFFSLFLVYFFFEKKQGKSLIFASILLCYIQVIGLIFLLFPNKLVNYLLFLQPVIVGFLVGISLLKLVRCHLRT